MYKLAILFPFFIFASGAIFYPPNLASLDENDLSETSYKPRTLHQIKGEDLWVLELNDEGLDLKTMRLANAKEEEIFERVVGPMIEGFKYRHGRLVKREEPVTETSETTRGVSEKRNKKMKQEMMRLINKFAMSVKSDPDAFLSDSASGETSGPSLVLYLKGVFTSLTVTSDQKIWHFFIPPPSPLPAWLYKCAADEVTALDIPDDVRDQLYVKLLHLLKMFLSYPV